jgi:hypothetical protein
VESTVVNTQEIWQVSCGKARCNYHIYLPQRQNAGTTNKVNQEETKPVVIYDYHVNMLGVELKDQMTQLHLLQ